jgi:hypothetical protein
MLWLRASKRPQRRHTDNAAKMTVRVLLVLAAINHHGIRLRWLAEAPRARPTRNVAKVLTICDQI